MVSGPQYNKLRRSFFALLNCLLFCQAGAAAATFTATLDRDTVAVGETATLSLTFEGGNPEGLSDLEIPNIKIDGPGVTQSFSFVNGKATSSVTETFVLTPMQPGDYIIPSLQAKVASQLLRSEPLKLKVVKPGSAAADAAGGDKLAFVKLFVPRKEI